MDSVNYSDIAISRLAMQFDGSTKLRELVSNIASQFSDIESAAYQLKTLRWIDTADGEQLDGCGAIVGEKRQGKSDSEYRKAIRFRIFVNTSRATPNDLIKGLSLLTESADSQYMEIYPATSVMFTDGFGVSDTIAETMQSLAPAAVSDIQVLVSYGAVPFRFSRLPPAAELWTTNDTEYLTIGDSDWTLSVTGEISGPSLGGLTSTNMEIDSDYIVELSDGSELVLNDRNSAVVIESGYHLTGVY